MFNNKTKTNKARKFLLFSLIFSFVVMPFIFSDINSSMSAVWKAEAANSTITDIEKKINAQRTKMTDSAKKRSALEAEIAQAERNKKNASSLKATYDQLVANIQEEIELTEDYIADNEEYMTQVTDTITEKQKQYDKTYERFLQVLQYSYENSSVDYIAMILNSDNFVEFLTKLDRMADIAENNRTIMKDLQDEKNDLDKKVAALEELREENEAYKKQLAESQSKLKNESQKASNAILSYDATIEDRKKQQDEIAQDEKNTQSEIQALTKALQNAKASQKTYVGGAMLWPVDRNWRTISSPFQQRINPITGRSEFHQGIDIPAAGGSNIYATNDGIVLQVKTSGSSYGKYIVLDHGGGTTTLYAHCSSIVRKIGDKVYKGDVIAKIGSTGMSTGNHIHFEVAENGVRQNPRQAKYVVQP